MEYINCDLCQIDDSRHLFESPDSRVVQCNRCGLIFINPRLKQESEKEAYADDYTLGYIAKQASKRRRARRIVKRISRFKKGGRFLDIGCSAGFILEAARNRGFEPYGVEIAPDALKYAKEKLGLQVNNGYIEEARFPDSFFDVITAYSVLEHVLYPTKFLQEMERILKDDGLIEIWTPDIGHRRAKKMGLNWPAFIPGHLWFFTLETLGKILNKAGLQIYKNRFSFKDGLRVYITKLPNSRF